VGEEEREREREEERGLGIKLSLWVLGLGPKALSIACLARVSRNKSSEGKISQRGRT